MAYADSEDQKAYRKLPHEKAKRAARSARELQESPARIKKNLVAYRHRLKAIVFSAYGNKCSCCGETEPKFLTIDHVNNDGHKNRSSNGRRLGSVKVYCWARRHGFPNTLRLLCWNCNCGRAHNGGVCPHDQQGG